jgi:starch synthase
LADVVTALGRALGRLGHRVTIVTPRYHHIQAGKAHGTVRAWLAGRWFEATLFETSVGDLRVVLLDCPSLYDRAGVYGENHADYDDNPLRFAFLSRAALAWAAEQPEQFSLVHAHDWQAGLVPVYNAGHLPSVFTIHNLAFQGVFDRGWVPALGLRWEDYTLAGFEFWERISYLKAGVMFSDALTTVSPTYAREIQRPEFGYGFDGIMRHRADVLTGVLNGIDDEVWDPADDPWLPASFSASDLTGKRDAKRVLLDLYGLPGDEAAMARPVVAMVSRMTEQKGLDLVAALAPHLPSLDATFVIAGTGDSRFEEMWRALAAANPSRFGVFIGYDERRAHLVEAGADMFMMPSRYEPCGLNQMYSMRYGTVPIVRAVGGLADTVRPFDQENGRGTGFRFDAYEPAALWEALQRALTTYRSHPEAWRRLQTNGMRTDFSWTRSAREYAEIYRRVLTASGRPAASR